MEQVRTFLGGLNTDDSVEIISADDWQYAANFISGRSQSSQNGAIENVRGTTSISTGSLLDANSEFIGGVRSVTDDIHYLCFYNSDPEKNCIIKLANDVVTNVITWEGLNFSNLKAHRINGGGIAGDLLYITDNYNEQRCIHTTRYTVTPPVTEEEILVIKRGPQLPPAFEKFLHGDEIDSYTLASTTSSTVVATGAIDGAVPQEGGLTMNGNFYSYTSWAGSTFSGVTPSPVGASGTIGVLEYLPQNLVNQFSFQFAHYYEYEDKQLSVLSPYSTLCAKSLLTEDYRRVRVTFPALESIPVLVKEIVVCARINNTGTFFEIGRLKKNAGVFDTLYFDFFNSTNGNVIDSFQSQPFSLVPRKSGSLALSKSRLWLGNILEGYDTPESIDLTQSLSVTYPSTSSTYTIYTLKRRTRLWNAALGVWGSPVDVTVLFDTTYQYIIQRGDYIDVVEYTPTWSSGDPDIIRHAGFTDIPKSGYADDPEPVAPADSDPWYTYIYVSIQSGVPIDFNPAISTLVGTKTFPSDSSYKIGIIFSDGQGRKCGVWTDDSLIVNTPRDQANKINIEWQLTSSDNIPEWARYYSIVITKNLKKSWYLENHSIDLIYRRTKSDGTISEYSGGGTPVHTDFPYVRVNIRNTPYNDLSYSFISGDRLILRQVGMPDEYDFDLEILSFDGSNLICARGDMAVEVIGSAYTVIEIYRPITTGGADLVFYEIGQTYKMTVVDDIPEFSVVSGIIEGDSIIVSRDVYELNTEVEDTGTDAAFKAISVDGDGVWNTDIGRPFIQTPVGEVQKSAYVRHSATFIAGTEINGLSDFDSGDEGNIPIESGTIQKLQPTNKESTEGDVLLAIANSDTFSIYIDEARMTAGTSSFLIGATRVIGDVRKQKSGFGTLHPESVHEEDGYVYYYDKLSRSFCRYATNGIFPLSEYKAVTYFEAQSDLNAITDTVVTGYDPFYKMLFVTFTNADTNTKKTIGFSLKKERWVGYFDFAPEGYVVGSKNLYSIKAGVLYKHSDTTNNNRFYGVDYNSVVEGSFNDNPLEPKEWRAVAVGCSPNLYSYSAAEQNVITNGLKVDVYNRQGQTTDILYDEFDVDENLVYGEIRGDKNTGTVLTGDPIFSETAQFRVTLLYGTNKYLLSVKAGYETSRGHTL